MDMRWLVVLWWIKKIRIVFYAQGINHYNINDNHDTIHAEVDCIEKLKKIKYNLKKKFKKVNVLVIRTNPKGTELLMSKPCKNCQKYLEENLYVNGFKLNKIYYTDKNAIINFK